MILHVIFRDSPMPYLGNVFQMIPTSAVTSKKIPVYASHVSQHQTQATRNNMISLGWPSRMMSSPTAHIIVSKFPTHEIPVGDTMHFERNFRITPCIVKGNPMPDASFSHVTCFFIKILHQLAIRDSPSQLYCLLQVYFVFWCPLLKTKIS